MQRQNHLPTPQVIDRLMRVAVSRRVFWGELLYVVSGSRTQGSTDDTCTLILSARQTLRWMPSGCGGPMWPTDHLVEELRLRAYYRVNDGRSAGGFWLRSVKLLDECCDK